MRKGSKSITSAVQKKNSFNNKRGKVDHHKCECLCKEGNKGTERVETGFPLEPLELINPQQIL